MTLHRKVKDCRGPEGVAHRASGQSLNLELPSVWGGKSSKFQRKRKEFVGQEGDAQREGAEFELRVYLSMGRKIIEIPKENEGIRRSGGPSRGASALHLSLG